MVSKHLVVSGKVQGVGFRNYTQRLAKRFEIIGWARNLASGEVEILALAKDETAMASFVHKVRTGPDSGRVDGVDIFEVDSKYVQGHTFEIAPDGETKNVFQ